MPARKANKNSKDGGRKRNARGRAVRNNQNSNEDIPVESLQPVVVDSAPVVPRRAQVPKKRKIVSDPTVVKGPPAKRARKARLSNAKHLPDTETQSNVETPDKTYAPATEAEIDLDAVEMTANLEGSGETKKPMETSQQTQHEDPCEIANGPSRVLGSAAGSNQQVVEDRFKGSSFVGTRNKHFHDLTDGLKAGRSFVIPNVSQALRRCAGPRQMRFIVPADYDGPSTSKGIKSLQPDYYRPDLEMRSLFYSFLDDSDSSSSGPTPAPKQNQSIEASTFGKETNMGVRGSWDEFQCQTIAEESEEAREAEQVEPTSPETLPTGVTTEIAVDQQTTITPEILEIPVLAAPGNEPEQSPTNQIVSTESPPTTKGPDHVDVVSVDASSRPSFRVSRKAFSCKIFRRCGGKPWIYKPSFSFKWITRKIGGEKTSPSSTALADDNIQVLTTPNNDLTTSRVSSENALLPARIVSPALPAEAVDQNDSGIIGTALQDVFSATALETTMDPEGHAILDPSIYGNSVQMPQRRAIKRRHSMSQDRPPLACVICKLPTTKTGPHRIVCLKCGDIFGWSCIANWLQNVTPSCPVCSLPSSPSDLRNIQNNRLVVYDNSVEYEVLSEIRVKRRRIDSLLNRLDNVEDNRVARLFGLVYICSTCLVHIMNLVNNIILWTFGYLM